MQVDPLYFHPFKSEVCHIAKPERFNFPFCYAPHLLSKIASSEVQDYLLTQGDFKHNFGLGEQTSKAIGKMFGVLIVEREDGLLGYLAACSGKLAGRNKHKYFVPPVYDMLTDKGFFLLEEEKINDINTQIEKLEANPEIEKLRIQLEQVIARSASVLSEKRQQMKRNREERRQQRLLQIDVLDEKTYNLLLTDLIKQSYRDQYEYRLLKEESYKSSQLLKRNIIQLDEDIQRLKIERKTRSAALQKRLFENYRFLNANGQVKSLQTIFNEELQVIPPAGAGECAAPKLLQYAFLHNLRPVALAEFWWGAPPGSEIRKHKTFYPCCRGKCEPILGHMLQGLLVDDNPMLKAPVIDKPFNVVFEDEVLLVVNKVAEFLSVPGIEIKDSVQTRVEAMYNKGNKPLIIHRLDMSTSGLLIFAKTKEAHKFVQQQFLTKEIIKRYVALIDGVVAPLRGEINLPIRVDLNDRPRQIVCYNHGKAAHTRFEVIERTDTQTKVYFYPITGRTHQLRVHSAHNKGLGLPIVGDDLYGKRADRLHLHAEYLSLIHPTTKERIEIQASAPF